MINHARTLLGNRDVAAYVSSFWPVPAEIVDGGFRPIPLSATLAAVDQALFGADPDPTMLTSRLAMLTDWLDHPVLAPYVLALDPRISYRHGDPSLFERLTFGTRFQYLVGDRMEVPGLLRGTEPSPDATGRCDFSWRLERTAEDEGTIFSEVPRGTLVTVDPAVLQPLPFSQHQVQLNLIPVGTVVRLVIRNKPSQGLATLGQKLTQLPPDTLGDVFDNILVEPTATFWRLWESDELLLKVGGFLLAYVYRLEGLRGA